MTEALAPELREEVVAHRFLPGAAQTLPRRHGERLGVLLAQGTQARGTGLAGAATLGTAAP